MDALKGLRFELKYENDVVGQGDETNENFENKESNEHDLTTHVCTGLVPQDFVVTQTRPWVKWCVWTFCLFAWFYFVGFTFFPYINNVGLAYLLYAAGVIAISKLVLKQVTIKTACLGICGPLVVLCAALGVMFGIGFFS